MVRQTKILKIIFIKWICQHVTNIYTLLSDRNDINLTHLGMSLNLVNQFTDTKRIF